MDAENRLTLTGQVTGPVTRRESPAGIPIARFVLEHSSRQSEAGMSREARCRINVVAAGTQLQEALSGLVPGEGLRVTGFIARAGYRSEEHRIVLHAQQIERITRGR